MTYARRISAFVLFVLVTVAPSYAATMHRTAPPAQGHARVAVDVAALGPGAGAGIVFVDALKQAAPWTSDRPLRTDRLGNVTALDAGQSAESVIYRGEPYPTGDYTLRYSGKGTFDAVGATIVARSPGRLIVRVTSSGGELALRLTATDPQDYVRGVHFVLPGFERTFALAPFHPQFVRALRGAGMLRFAQWMHGGSLGTSQVSLLRPTSGATFQTAAPGVAVEYEVALANATAADPWFTIPAGATDGYVYALADVVHRTLDPRLHPVFEYADGAWRLGSPPNAWAVMAGHSMHFSGSDQQVAQAWYELRSKQIFAVAQRAFGLDAGRLVRAVQAGLPDGTSSYAFLERTGLQTVAVVDAHDIRSGAGLAPNPAFRFVPTPASEEAAGPRAQQVRPVPVLARPSALVQRESQDSQAPVLTGELGVPLHVVDLTREGTVDWVHWGSPSLSADRKRTDGAQIGDVARIGSAQLRAAAAFATYAWRDGAVQAQARTRSGIAVAGAGNGFELSAPADTTTRTLRVYVAAHDARGRLTATLSDGSRPEYADDEVDSAVGGTSGVYTLVYRAATAAATVRVRYTLERSYAAGGTVALESATLDAGARPPSTPTSELTFHNDNSVSGWNQNETTLTTSNVHSSSFGLLQTIPVDGVVLAQPLYVAQYSLPSQGVHNLLIVATENDTLYEFDADTYALLNSRNFGPAQNSNDVGCSDIEPQYGITSTPVIDPSTGTIYLVAANEPHQGKFHATLHALDIGTLADTQKPVNIAASVQLSNGQTVNFDPQNQQSRTSLAFNSGSLYVGIGSHCDNNAGATVGWLLKYNGSLTQTAAFPTVDDSAGYMLSSVWMSGYPSAIGASGNVITVTGNGAFDAASGGHNYGESVIAVDPNLGGVLSYFTPLDWANLNNGDTDFGSGGVMLLPPQQASTADVAVAMGKASMLYLVNQDALGGLGTPLQAIKAGGGGVWGGPAFYSGPSGQFVYYQTGGSVLRAYKVKVTNRGKVRLVAKSAGISSAGYGGSSPVVSSDAQEPGTGIVWLVERNSTLTLEAYDASNLANMLFSGPAGTWQNPENNGFVTPLVANGKVYVPATGTVTVFGLQ